MLNVKGIFDLYILFLFVVQSPVILHKADTLKGYEFPIDIYSEELTISQKFAFINSVQNEASN